MIGLVVLMWILFFVFFITFVILFFVFKKYNRDSIIKKYETELYEFDINSLENKVSSLGNKIKIDKNDLSELQEDYNSLKKINFNELTNYYEYIKKNNSFFRFKKFLQMNKKLFDIQFEYKISYLRLLFKINEYNLKSEIKHSMLFYLKNNFNFLNQKINDSNFKNEILSSNKIKNKIVKIEDLIEEIVSLSENLKCNLKTFVKKIYEVTKQLIDVEKDINFVIQSFEMINVKFKDINDNFQKITKDNRQAFIKNINGWKVDFSNLNLKIKETKLNIYDLEKSIVERDLVNMLNLLVKITKRALLNKESYLFIKDFDKKIEYILKNFQKDEKLVLMELNQFDLVNKKVKIEDFKKINSTIQSSFNSYLTKRKKEFKDHEPLVLINDLKKIQLIIDKYFVLLENTYLEVKNILSKNDDLNKKVYDMNIKLLKSEDKIEKTLPSFKFIYDQELEKYQKEVSRLIYEYKNNMKIPEDSKLTRVSSLHNDINKFYQKIETESFKFIYTQKLIITLNKYGNLSSIDKLLVELKTKYLDGNIIDSLRLGKKIIEIGKIYE